MRWLIVVLSLLVFSAVACAEETLREISWSKLEEDGKLASGEVLRPDDEVPFERLKVANSQGTPSTEELLTIEGPGITGPAYAITGKVSYEGVEGKGYLEMWSFFPDGGSYFSRTLAESGPTGRLEGSSDWRLFSLPFFISEKPQRPERLVVNVVLPGRGTVYLGALRLVQYAEGADVLAAPGQWWSNRTSGFIGGAVGVVLGSLGGLIGLLAPKGKGRRFVIGALKVMILFGLASLIGGAVALVLSQPFWVCYPFLLAGLLSTAIPWGLLPSIRRRYETMELRKMNALDAP